MKQINKKLTGGYIALMATIIISLVLLTITIQEGSSGWYARFNILGTESKEQANALAEGCAEQAQATLLTDPSFMGNLTIPSTHGVCNILPIEIDSPTPGLVTIKTQGVVNNSYANLNMIMEMNDLHLNAIPSAPSTGTLFITIHVINDSSGSKTANDVTVNVAAISPSQNNFPGNESGTPVIVQPSPSYSVTGTSLANYSLVYSSGCNSATGIAAGEIKFCTITYDDITTTLTLIANVINDNNGTTLPKDIALTLDASSVTLGMANPVLAGSHTVSAVTPSGYAVSVWGYDCNAGGTISMTLGQNKTCVINFNDFPPPAPTCADTVMILDRTGSMFNNPNDPIYERNAASALVALYAGVLPPATPPQIGVGSIGGLYGGTAAQVPDNTHPVVGWLTTVYSKITSAVTSMTSSNSTVGSDLSAGITVASDELNSTRHLVGKQKVLILVSDGDPNEPSGATTFDTGFKSPSANIQNATGELWNNPTNAYSDGAGDASDPVTENDRHLFYNFGFGSGSGLPSGSTIRGIEVVADAWATSAGSIATTSPLSPSNLGNYSEWTPNTGTDVNAVNSNNGDTSYIDTGASIETFDVQDAGIPSGSTINSVTISVVAKGSPANAVMQIVAEKGGILSVGPNVTVTSASYNTYTRVMTTDPSGAAWTLSEVNAWTSRFGVRTTNSSNTPRVTQVFVNVSYNTPTPGNTGFKTPTITASSNQFTNPTRAFASDNSYATETNDGDRQGYGGFGFTVPLTATIMGIEVNAEARSSDSTGCEIDVDLSQNASSFTSNETISLNGADTVFTEGNSSNDWGRTWTPGEINGSGFTVRLEYVDTSSCTNGSTLSLDFLQARVHYTAFTSATTSPLSPSNLGNYSEWTPNTGTDVNAVNSNNGDTSYIDTGASIETFDVQDAGIPSGSTINSVTISVVAKGSPANAVMQIVAEKGGILSVGPNVTVTSASYNTYTRVMTTDPSGAAWTLSEVNAWTSRFGVRTTNSSNTPRVTQVFVNVSYNVPGGAACQIGVDLSWNAGTGWTSAKTQNINGTETSYTLGASNDDWSSSHTWAASEFCNTNFRSRVQAIDPGSGCDNSAVEHLDWLQIKIHYTQSVDPIQAALNAADTAKTAGISLFTIHFGSDPSGYTGRELLANLATGATPVSGHQNGSLADPTGVTSGTVGPISPAAQTSTSGGDGNGFEVTPVNALTDGPSGIGGAAQNINGAADRHIFSGYNFALPPGATITGIGTRLDWWLNSTSGTNSMSVELSWDTGVTWTSAITDSNESTSVSNSRTLGGPGNLWGHAWTVSELDSTKFKVRVTSNSNDSTRDFYLDWIPVTVYYTVNTENGDGDNFFVAPTSGDMQGIFNFIGQQVCPAALNIAATPPPTIATIIVITNVTNNNGAGSSPSDFTGRVNNATNPSVTSFAGSSSGFSITVNPGGFNITEDSLAGYIGIPGPTCQADSSSNPINAGETRICIINNDDIPPPPPPPNLDFDTNSWQETPN